MAWSEARAAVFHVLPIPSPSKERNKPTLPRAGITPSVDADVDVRQTQERPSGLGRKTVTRA